MTTENKGFLSNLKKKPKHTQRRRLPDRTIPQQKLLHTKGVTDKGDCATAELSHVQQGKPQDSCRLNGRQHQVSLEGPRPRTQASQ